MNQEPRNKGVRIQSFNYNFIYPVEPELGTVFADIKYQAEGLEIEILKEEK